MYKILIAPAEIIETESLGGLLRRDELNVITGTNHALEVLKAAQASQPNLVVFSSDIEGMSIVALARSTANFRGVQGRVQYAEAFCSVRLFVEI